MTLDAASTDTFDLRLIAGESVICTEKNVAYMGPFGRVRGKIIVTRYRLCFFVNDPPRCFQTYKLEIALGMISKIEKYGYASASRKDDSYGFVIHCKDYRTYKFSSDASTHSRRIVCDAVNKYAFPLSFELPFFAINYCAESPIPVVNGWKVFSIEREFERMGLNGIKQWQMVDVNLKYKFSETYPAVFAIPTSSAEEGATFLKKIGEFRSRQRIPVLSWIDRSSLAAITRSSQPMCGMTGRKNVDDEAHLKNIMFANAHCYELQIYDARPNVNAAVNKAKGGGYEENYDNCRLTFLSIHNIHIVRESMKKLSSILLPTVDEKNYYKLLEESKWLIHVQSILEGSLKIVYDVDTNKQSVLVHCTDGWDRTAQLTSLAMLQLDAYYRSIEGFIVLIEKEWCSFGHKFGQRYGHGDDNSGDSERSPIFPQFLDCVWQIMQQYPTCFEFTQNLLITILDEMYSCKYGTFLYNNEKMRLYDNKCNENTISLWSYVLENKNAFMNPIYVKNENVIYVNSSSCSLRVWTDYYARSNPNVITPNSQNILLLETQPAYENVNFMEQIRALERVLNIECDVN